MKAFEEIRDAEERASAIAEDAEKEEKRIIASASERGEKLLADVGAEIFEKRASMKSEKEKILASAKEKASSSFAEEKKRIRQLADKNMDRAVELVFKRMVSQWQ